MGTLPNFLCIAKNIGKEAAGTFLAGVMPAGGFEPPFCYHAYSDYFKRKVPESNRPHGLLVHLTVIAPRDIPFHNRQRTFIVLFSRFLSRQRFHHKKNFICYTKIRQPCHTNAILQRIGIAGIEPATTRI